MVKLAIGSFGDSFSVGSLKAYLVEFISTLLFVFVAVGSAIGYSKFQTCSAFITLAHAFALFMGVSMAANISDGHLNPAITLGLVVGGHITIITSIFYLIAQLLGSIIACFLFKFVTNDSVIPTHGVAAGMTNLGGVVMEIVINFALVYTMYATAVDPKKESLGTIASITIGFIVGANILAAGPFSGGSMNPARSFGLAIASVDFFRKLNLLGGSTYWGRACWIGEMSSSDAMKLFLPLKIMLN
ncbi:hypothetical protein GIB67_014245 [Kingdonia uniflora]|uniref:Uncharacterized protein n=1 Tax=Kingdonia uniflora TaxID=39325 RepID=A0A7J7M243_9MAGN|nr:hypothetical protein GIB67_014245 [Kingdonia uniflora]